MAISIREVHEDDLPVILDIYNDQILHGTATFHTELQNLIERTQWLEDLRTKRYPCFVAEATDEATRKTRTVAWCNLWYFKERPAYDATAEVSLYVHKDFQGLGVGKSLLGYTLDHAKKQGDRFHVIIASVTAENTSTTRFWEKQGFELRGTVKEVGRKFGRWLDVSYYQLML